MLEFIILQSTKVLDLMAGFRECVLLTGLYEVDMMAFVKFDK